MERITNLLMITSKNQVAYQSRSQIIYPRIHVYSVFMACGLSFVPPYINIKVKQRICLAYTLTIVCDICQERGNFLFPPFCLFGVLRSD